MELKEGQKYVIYTRVSTSRQGDSGIGIDTQKMICRKEIARLNGEELDVFEDTISGGSNDRPILFNAMKVASAHNAVLIFSSIDRLARNEEIAFKVRNFGVNLHFCDMPEIDSFVFCIMSGLAAKERDKYSTRSKANAERIKSIIEKDGYYITSSGRAITKFGGFSKEVHSLGGTISAKSRKEKKRLNENWLQVLKVISVMSTQNGSTLQKIADTLNEMGFKTFRGKMFYPQQVKNALIEYNNIQMGVCQQ